MAKTLGAATTVATPLPINRSSLPAAEGVAPARRSARPGWRDPRLWVGAVIVAASVVVGARTLAASDDTVQVWAAAQDLGAGQTLTAADLVAERVHFGDGSQLAAYYRTDQALPDAGQLTRTIGAGELLARSAVGSSATTGLLEVPIAVDPEQVPASVHAGAVVDVYLVAPGSTGTSTDGTSTDGTSTDGTTTDGTGTGTTDDGSGGASGDRSGGPAISAATVVDAPATSTSFGATGKRQLVLAVADDQARAFFALLSRYDAPVLTVVRRG